MQHAGAEYYIHMTSNNAVINGIVKLQLQISLRVIERTLREHCPEAPLSAKYGGITYILRTATVAVFYRLLLADSGVAETVT